MNQLYPIIRRPRRTLHTDIRQDATPVVTVCPHCGRSSAEPAVPAPEPPKTPDAEIVSHGDAE
jgi:hypothetical protein